MTPSSAATEPRQSGPEATADAQADETIAPPRQRASGQRAEQPADPPTLWWRRPSTWLITVAILHAISPLLLMGARWPLGVDESIYLSQINSFVPAAGFSAPRARGATLLAAPITLLTPSLVAVRLWVALLSGVGMYLAYRPWLRLRDGYLVPLAALLLSTLWTVIFYSFQVMPNQWVAYTTVAATGYTVLFVRDGRRRHLVAALVAMALTSLMRPSDAIFAGIGLAVACLVVVGPVRRRLQIFAALVIGGALGFAEWVIEAEVRYGGFFTRMQAAQTENKASGLVFTLGIHAGVLKGQTLCEPGCHPKINYLFVLWWFALAVLLVAGLVHAWRRRHLRAELVPFAVGVATAAQYLFNVYDVAPRFLVPAYAMFSLTAAMGVRAILHLVRRGWPRTAVGAVLVAALVAHTVLQVAVLANGIVPSRKKADAVVASATSALQARGLSSPCVVIGQPADVTRLFYALGCSRRPRAKFPADGTKVIWFSSKPPPAGYAPQWWPVEVQAEPASKHHPAWVNFAP